MSNYRRDFETVEEYRARLSAEAAERATFEADLGKVLDEPPPGPWVVDCGIYTSRADLRAIQAAEDRITRLERMGR